MDPQVRNLLEVVWETLQDAGIPPQSARGSNTGVYMGFTGSEYSILVSLPEDNINVYSNSGVNSCMMSNRVSYEYDFHGPSITINTACSSSLYSILLACDGIRKGQCDMAVAGGVNLLLLQFATISFCQGQVLSPDGKCKTFDKSADGFSRGEGVGAVVLKSLQSAIEDGDRIYAVIRGGALTNDGRTAGIARPNYDEQVTLLGKAYENARVDPRDVTYLEAHGTGTKVGDMTEANAIGEAMGLKRRSGDSPLYIGSVKTNVAHTESAAGVAGVIKLALILQHGQIPKQVHFTSENENVDFTSLNIRVPTELMRWPDGGKKIVGCSSFGFGGANAHIVLEGYKNKPLVLANKDRHSRPNILFISAASKKALLQYLKDWEMFINDKIRDGRLLFRNALFTAAARSTHHAHRVCIIARSPQETKNQIRLKLDQNTGAANGVIEGQARDEDPSAHRLVFVYSGMGAQWWGMARRLMTEDPTFANAIKVIDKILTKCGAKWSVQQYLSSEEDQEKIDETDVAQPCLCAVQIGLTEYYRSRGIIPSAIVGHSVGEVAAAHAAGYLTLEDAVRLIYTRGQQLKKTSGLGMMVAVLHPVEEITARLKESQVQGKIDIAAINSPTQIVLSGDGDALSELTDNLRREGIRCISLRVNNAFHSYQQEQIEKSFLEKVSYLNTSLKKSDFHMKSTTPLISSVTSEYIDGNEVCNSAYWWMNIRQTVQFMAAIQKLLQKGYNYFLEIGPHPVLSSSIRDIAKMPTSKNNHLVVTGSLQRPSDTKTLADDDASLLSSISRLHVEGFPVDHEQLFQESPYEVTSLPTYPWEHVFCSGATDVSNRLFRFPNIRKPLLGERLLVSHLSEEESPVIWSTEYSQVSVPWLWDHKLHGNAIIPAAAHIDTMITAAQEVKPDDTVITLTDVNFEQFTFAQSGGGRMEVTIQPGLQESSIKVKSFNHTDSSWKETGFAKWDVTTKASIQPLEDVSMFVRLSTTQINDKFPIRISQSDFYESMWEQGYHLGESFRSVSRAYCSHEYNEALVYATLPESLLHDSQRYNFHPAFLDSIFQGFGVCQILKTRQWGGKGSTSSPLWFQVPSGLAKIHIMGKAPLQIMFHLRITKREGVTYGNVVVADATTQRVFSRIEDMIFQVVNFQYDEKVQIWRREWSLIVSNPKETDNASGTLSHGHQVRSSGGETILVRDRLGISEELRKLLDKKSITFFDPLKSDDVEQDFRDLLQAQPDVKEVVILSALDVTRFVDIDTISKDIFSEAQQMTALTPVSLFRVVTSLDSGFKPQVWLVTSGAHSVSEGDAVNPLMSPTSSLSLTLMHEDPELQIITVDVPATLGPQETAIWLSQYMTNGPTSENHVALRRKQSGTSGSFFDIHANRIALEPQSTFSFAKMSNTWDIHLTKSITEKQLVAEQCPLKTSPPENNIDVKISSFAAQKLPDDTNGCGYIFSGEITRSTACAGFEEGTTVLGFGMGDKLPNNITTGTSDLIPVPDNITSIEAINIVKDYLPSFIAVQKTMKDGNSATIIVCIASENDHVGEVTLKLALQTGARAYVHMDRKQGTSNFQLNHNHVTVLSSHTLEKQLSTISADVLMFSGVTPPDPKTLSKLARRVRPFGTIVQLGDSSSKKTATLDFPSTVYFVATGALFGQHSGKVAEISRLLQMFGTDDNFPLNTTRARSATPISKLSKPASLNSVTVYVDQDSIPALVNMEDATFSANPEASYLVTGGSKGFGVSIVEWLVSSGARHIYVTSRNTPPVETMQRFKVLQERGASIKHVAADMVSEHDIELALFAIKEDKNHPLEGVFHSATQFRDAYLQNMTKESWDAVMMSKAFGALLLHQLTIKLEFPLKHFVLVSSVVELIGNRGQGSYCAANSFLSSLCALRRNRGLPACSLMAGVINSVGFAAREGLVEHWQKIGLESLSPVEMLTALEYILPSGETAIGVSGALNLVDFSRGFNVMLSNHFSQPGGKFSVLKSLVPPGIETVDSGRDMSNQVRKCSPEEAKAMVIQTLSAFLSERIGYSGEMSLDAPLLSLGVDSHLSSDLSNVINESFGVNISAMALLNDTLTIRILTENIYERVQLKGEGGEEYKNMKIDDQKDELWCDINKKIDTPSAQLVCFPAFGGGPSMFLPWKSRLADQNIQLITIQLPGWERREHEKPMQNLQDIVTKVGDVLLPNLVRGRFAFFGHSIGALLAFEMAHHLRENYNMSPAHLFVSSWHAPALPFPRPADLDANGDVYRRIQRIMDSHLKSSQMSIPNGQNGRSGRIGRNGQNDHPALFSFLDPSAANNARLRRSLVPSLRAAVSICKKYCHVHRDKLSVNLTVFGGKDDEFIRTTMLDEWKTEVSPRAKFQKVLFPGQHMYLHASSKQVLKKVVGTLNQTHSTGIQKRSRSFFRR